jgi:phosphoglycerate kinase
VAERLHALLGPNGVNVKFMEDCIGGTVEKAKKSLSTGEVLLLENLRFYKEEIDNDAGFAQHLCNGIDIYINEAFAASHRGKKT